MEIKKPWTWTDSEECRIARYFNLKRKHAGLLMVRMAGDFYEAFGADAEIIARDLNLSLTTCSDSSGNRLGLVGAPAHAIERYADGLRDAGWKVALVDETQGGERK